MLTISPTKAIVQESLNGSMILERTLRSTKDFNRILKVDSHYLSITDGHREFFATIQENGKLELSYKPKGELSFESTRCLGKHLNNCGGLMCQSTWVLDISAINIKENTPEECVWKVDFESWRLRPSQDSNKPVQFGLYTRNFGDVILYLKDEVKKTISPNSPECLNVKRRLRHLALDELKRANKTLEKIRTIRQKIQEAASEEASAIFKLIDELIQIRFKLEMLRWDRDCLSGTDKKEYVGFFGILYEVPNDDRNRLELFTSIMDREKRLKYGEKWIVRQIFSKTLKMFVWNGAFKKAYMKKQSFSNILRGLNILSENEGDIERQLYLITRYLPRDFLSGTLPPLKEFTFELQDRAVLLKLEEIVVKQNDGYFMRKLSCLEDMIKDLPGRSTRNNV
ncbi:unnamed protein product [Hymenolepis diminuta]|uniref:CHAD domain-containing protein n=1 Tax=Hymenolepis diminuta TaxID=6216 RepID=A0A0R3SRL7_HYMDI|nr:unnamed protein product [Hymenolepis diminuta]